MTKKRYAAVICEYNPFHYGHLKQIEYLKNEFDGVICIMSGNLVQRGEIAVADKYSRAKAAVMCGASLVVSLPFPYCMMSARDFAAAGVYIAAMLGADALGFGCEDDFSMLERIFEETSDINFERELEDIIKSEKNLSYPKAKELLVAAKLGEKAAEIIRKPNNILTLEYLSAIKKGGYNIKPYPVTRDITLRSSSSIRAEKSRSQFLSLLPECSAAVYGGLSEEELPRSAENLSQYLLGMLRRYKATESDRIYGTPSDLANTILSASKMLNSFSLLIDICRNSLYTSARVRRSVLSMVFGVTPEDAVSKPLYTMLLAADEEGCTFLKNRKKQLGIPLITKPAHIKKEPEHIQKAFFRENEIDSVLLLSAPGVQSDNIMEKTPFIKFNK
jgi:predicted nucleotidyltransferase